MLLPWKIGRDQFVTEKRQWRKSVPTQTTRPINTGNTRKIRKKSGDGPLI